MTVKRKKLDIYQDAAGGWRWRLRWQNGRIVATSGEAYSSRRKAEEAIGRLADAIIDRTLYMALFDALKASRA